MFNFAVKYNFEIYIGIYVLVSDCDKTILVWYDKRQFHVGSDTTDLESDKLSLRHIARWWYFYIPKYVFV